MATYKVIVHEINELTYEIKATSAQQALDAYFNTDLERPLNGDILLSIEPVAVIDPDGKETGIEELEMPVSL